MTPPERKCANCRAWHKTSDTEGECRRRSPTSMNYPPQPTSADFWCLDFQRIRQTIAPIGRPPLFSDESILSEVRKAEKEGYDINRNWVVAALEPNAIPASTIYKRINALIAGGTLMEQDHPTLTRALRIAKEPPPPEPGVEPATQGRGRIHGWNTLGKAIVNVLEGGPASASKIRRVLKQETGKDVGHDTMLRVLLDGVEAKKIHKTGSLYRAITKEE